MLTRLALAARFSLAGKAISICLIATPAMAPTLAPGSLADQAAPRPAAAHIPLAA